MIQPPGEQRRPPMWPPQLARRVTFLGGVALAMWFFGKNGEHVPGNSTPL